MALRKDTLIRILKNTIITLLIYLTPILLMLLYFHLKGEKPWEKQINNTKALGK
jgi:hypothetical protein